MNTTEKNNPTHRNNCEQSAQNLPSTRDYSYKSSTRQKNPKYEIVTDKDGYRFARCGIAAVKTAVVSLKRVNQPNFTMASITEIAEKTKKKGGYLEGIGWIHRNLVETAKSYDLKSANYSREHYLAISTDE